MLKDIKLLWNTMRIYLVKKWHIIFLGFITATLFSLASLATPYLTKYLIDVVFGQKRHDLLLKLIFLCSILVLTMSLIKILSEYILVNTFEKIKMKMRNDLFSKLLNNNIPHKLHRSSGEMYYRIFNDGDIIESFFNNAIINVPLYLFVIISLGTIMISWNFKMTIFVYAILFAQISLIILSRKKLLKYSFLSKSLAQSLSGFFVERLRNIPLIISLNSTERELKSSRERLEHLKKINVKLYMYNNVIHIIISILNNLWTFGILWYGGRLVEQGTLTLGSLMAFMLVAGIIFPNLQALTKLVLSFQDVRVSLHRFLEYYNAKPLVSELASAKELVITEGEIVFQNVKFGYNCNELILDGINIKIKPKNIVAIVGRNGIGKSTIARLLVRMYDPIEGSIMIDGVDIRDVTTKSLRNNIGYLIQGEFLFNGTILDNIKYVSNFVTEQDVIEACRKACAYDFIMNLPNKFQTIVGEGGFHLSGGEAQRIALARSFLMKYPIVILDEPTSFIDKESEKGIHRAITDLKENSTIIMIAHNLSSIKIADQLVVLNQNGLVEQGSDEELLLRSDSYYKIYQELGQIEHQTLI